LCVKFVIKTLHSKDTLVGNSIPFLLRKIVGGLGWGVGIEGADMKSQSLGVKGPGEYLISSAIS
jgi:hypothetical protein